MALPTPKLERWKYSNLPAYVSGEYDEKPLTVVYNGNKSYLDDKPVVHTPWAQDDYGDMQLWDGLQDVMSVTIPVDTHVDKPVNISLQVLEGQKQSGHLHITLQKGASLTVYEDIDVAGWCIRTLTIELGEGANLTHIRTGKGGGVVTNLTQIKLAKESRYSAYAMNTYGAFMRDQIHARLEGEKSECLLSGTKILKGEQHCDTTILIEHMAPHCQSNQNYRNLLDDRSRGVFQGKVHVHQIAQQTDGYQLCNSVLLSERAEMDTKPELEIYADDVRCSHGATTAAPDDEPLFYLMARGIPEIQARNMLLQAFLNESLEAFEEDEDIFTQLSEYIQNTLN